ncbi:leucine-rich_repeat protein [Hexamita inflata]|uniref:Leucine-rich_repeat protein n=1 Tax=Hexamita inflata TaxID=28002 RepID=A0ABP1GX49_9EUKA
MDVNISKSQMYKNSNAEQIKYLNKYQTRVFNAELHIECDNSLRNLQFINQLLDITKLTLTFCENIDFSTLPNKIQQIHIMGPCDLKGLEQSQVKYIIHQQELNNGKSNQLIFSDDSSSLDDAFFFSEENNLLTIEQKNQQRTLQQYEESQNIIRFKLCRIQTLEYLQLNQYNLIDLNKFSQQQLKFLDLRDNKQIIGTTYINLPCLTHINLSGSNITDINYLAQIQNLICIDISQNSIYNLEPLRHLKFIERLNASENKISELPTLQCENTLKYLDISLNENINIVNIQNLSKLKELYVQNINLKKLNFLKDLTQLQILDINNNLVSNLYGIQCLLNLQTFIAGYNQIQNICSLILCEQLHTLLLHHNFIKIISVVSNLKYLKEIDITNNLVEDISAIKYLPNLLIFNVGHNLVKDVSFLSECHYLQEINIEHNLIQRLGRVNSSLTKLQLNDNQILDVDEFLAQSKQLQILQLNNNYIYNLEVLHMNHNFWQKEIDLSYLRRNISNEVAEDQSNNILAELVGDVASYKKDYLNLYDQYYQFKYINKLQEVNRDYYVQTQYAMQIQKQMQNIQQIIIKRQQQHEIRSLNYIQQSIMHSKQYAKQENNSFSLLISNEENLKDVYFVQNLKLCEVLIIDKCLMVNFSRAPLNVTHLQIKDCELKSIQGIQQMTNLVSFNVSNNQLVDISQLQFLVNLKYLDASQNQIIYVYPLRNLQLTHINVNNNYIPKEQLQLNKNLKASQREYLLRSTQKQLDVYQKLYYEKLLYIDKLLDTYANIYSKQKSIEQHFSIMKTKVNKLLYQKVVQLTFIVTQTVIFIQNISGPFE